MTALTLTLILIVSIYLVSVAKKDWQVFSLSIAVVIIAPLWLFAIICISAKGCEYRETVADREAIVMSIETLKTIDKYETASISSEVIKFNKYLAQKKRYRKLKMWKEFVDRRFENMDYITFDKDD